MQSSEIEMLTFILNIGMWLSRLCACWHHVPNIINTGIRLITGILKSMWMQSVLAQNHQQSHLVSKLLPDYLIAPSPVVQIQSWLWNQILSDSYWCGFEPQHAAPHWSAPVVIQLPQRPVHHPPAENARLSAVSRQKYQMYLSVLVPARRSCLGPPHYSHIPCG